MIASNISGIRLLPLFKCSLSYLKTMFSDSGAWAFVGAPPLQVVLPSGTTAPAIKLVNFNTNTETVKEFSTTTISQRGVNYEVYTVAADTTVAGTFYYVVNVGSDVFYSPIFTTTCAQDFKITYSHTCNSVLTGLSDFVNEIQIPTARIVPDGTAGVEDAIELSDGTVSVTNRHIRTVWRMELLASRELFERLNMIGRYDNVQINTFGTTYDVKRNTFRAEGGQPGERATSASILFELQTEDEIVNCFCPEFTDEGEEINDAQQGGDVNCPNLVVSIDSSNLPTLSSVVIRDPLEAFTTKWYKNGVFFSTAASINIGVVTANWELRVKMEGCTQKTAVYTHINECNAFAVTPSVVGNTINANYSSIPTGQNVTVRVLSEAGVSVSTSLPYTPTDSGTYTLEATAGTCIKTVAVRVNVSVTDCEFTPTIEANGATFNANIAGAPEGSTPSYEWLFIDENNNITTIGLTDSVTPNATGFYRVRVTIGSCTVDSAGRVFVAHTDVRIVNPVTTISDNRWRYELFTIDSGSSNNFDGTSNSVVVTRGVLPDITGLGAEAIQDKIKVHLNPNSLNYADPTTYVAEFSIDNDTNSLIIHENLTQWDVLNILFLEDLQ